MELKKYQLKKLVDTVIIDPYTIDGDLIEVKDFVEKPEISPPSNLAIMGRYVLTPDIFAYLDEQEIEAGGEIQLIDAINRLKIKEEYSRIHS